MANERQNKESHGSDTGNQENRDRQAKAGDGGLKQSRSEPLGDRGQGGKTQPPSGKQGLSNRPDDQDDDTDETKNQGQKTVQGKNQKGPEHKVGKSAGGNEGSKGQNMRDQTDEVGKGGQSVGSHKPGGDGPGTKKFKHDHDPAQPKDRNAGSQAEEGNPKKANGKGPVS